VIFETHIRDSRTQEVSQWVTRLRYFSRNGIIWFPEFFADILLILRERIRMAFSFTSLARRAYCLHVSDTYSQRDREDERLINAHVSMNRYRRWQCKAGCTWRSLSRCQWIVIAVISAALAHIIITSSPLINQPVSSCCILFHLHSLMSPEHSILRHARRYRQILDASRSSCSPPSLVRVPSPRPRDFKSNSAQNKCSQCKY